MIENFLEFDSGFGALVRGEMGQATHIDRVQRAKKAIRTAGYAQLTGDGGLEKFESFRNLSGIQREETPKRGQVAESNRSIPRESLFEIVRQLERGR